MSENEIERLIKEASETGPDTDVPISEPTSRQSFRIVGGADAAQVVIQATSNIAVRKVAVTAIGPERYLAVPVRDVPAEGYSIEENGYNANTTKARVEVLLGPGSHLSGRVWTKALGILDIGGKIIFTRSNTSVNLRGKQVFPVRIVE